MKNLLLTGFLFFSFLAYSNNFSKIDDHARNAPRSVQKSVEKLTEYLVKPAKDDTEKVRAFYVWISENIAYDVDMFFSSIIPTEEITGNDVLRTRKGVCQGYSQLFKEMCDLAEIQCFIIPGYSKGYGWKPTRKFESSDHAWNIVLIDNKWKLIDATWGSGFLNQSNRFEKRFEEKYFLADPEQFIYDHLPSDPMWQLLDCPITIEEFKKDSTEIKNILANKEACFNYNDSIAYFLTLREPEQRLHSALSANRFNPFLTDDVGFAYMNYAYDKTLVLMDENGGLSNQEKYDLQKEILEIYKTSKVYLKKSNSNYAKSALQIVNENIKNSEHNLSVFKKILDNN